MTDRESRERLIEILTKSMDEQYEKRRLITPQHTAEDLLANGVIVPPCKVGETLYQIVDMSHTACKSFVSDFTIKVLPYQIYYLNLMGGVSAIPFEEFGKTVFLTREEAEAKLKEREGNESIPKYG